MEEPSELVLSLEAEITPLGQLVISLSGGGQGGERGSQGCHGGGRETLGASDNASEQGCFTQLSAIFSAEEEL